VPAKPGRFRRFLATLARGIRWQPTSHPQVWGLAAGTALLCLAAVLTVRQRVDVGLAIYAVFLVVCSGSVGSYRLSRRRDAAVPAEWERRMLGAGDRSASRPPQQ
jgi:hypothetical protein